MAELNEPLAKFGIVQELVNVSGGLCGLRGMKIQRGPASHLGQTAAARMDDGTPGAHCLKHRQAKALQQ